jgi:hypothetical protein
VYNILIGGIVIPQAMRNKVADFYRAVDEARSTGHLDPLRALPRIQRLETMVGLQNVRITEFTVRNKPKVVLHYEAEAPTFFPYVKRNFIAAGVGTRYTIDATPAVAGTCRVGLSFYKRKLLVLIDLFHHVYGPDDTSYVQPPRETAEGRRILASMFPVPENETEDY